jgi:hypothetical protein
MREPTTSHAVQPEGSTQPIRKLTTGHEPKPGPCIFQPHRSSQKSSSCRPNYHIPLSLIVIVFQEVSPTKFYSQLLFSPSQPRFYPTAWPISPLLQAYY